MKKSALLSLLCLMTTSCQIGNEPPSPNGSKPDNEHVSPNPNNPSDLISTDIGILFDQNKTTWLYTKSVEDGLLDFKLYTQNKQSGAIQQVKLPTNAIVIGAAFKDSQHLFVAVNMPHGVDNSKSVVYQINLNSQKQQVILDSEKNEFSGIEFNSLTYQDQNLRFFGLKPHQYHEHDQAHDADHSHWMNKLTLYKVHAKSNRALSIADGSKEEQKFSKLFTQTSQADLTGQRLQAQGKRVRPFLRFPKALASRNVPGSPYHKGRDLYALDLNRGGGNDDLHDGAVAAAGGQVILSKYGGRGYGHFIIIRHAGGYNTLYAHLNKRVVRTGQRVYQGQYIGNIGRSGGQRYAHLHFVFYKGRTPLRVASPRHPMQASYGKQKCPIKYFPNNRYVKLSKCP